MKSRAIFGLSLLFFCIIVQADEGDTGWRNLTNFGCHLNDGTCYFDVDGGSVGEATCSNTNIRFNTKISENGDTWTSLILAAYIAGKRVRFNISGCYGNYPTFSYGRIEK